MDEEELWLVFAAAAVAGGHTFITNNFMGEPEGLGPYPQSHGCAEFADQMVIQYRKRFGYDEPQIVIPGDGEEETTDEG